MHKKGVSEKITQFFKLERSCKGIQVLKILCKQCAKKRRKSRFLCRVAMLMSKTCGSAYLLPSSPRRDMLVLHPLGSRRSTLNLSFFQLQCQSSFSQTTAALIPVRLMSLGYRSIIKRRATS